MPMRLVRLSSQQFMYLRNTTFLPDACVCAIEGFQPVDDGYVLNVSDSLAERFREAFTERLAKVGFDKSYKLTREGEILEGLIDGFGLTAK